MSWQVDVSVWADKPDSIQVFSDDGREQDYIPERTCRLELEEPEADGVWWCSYCKSYHQHKSKYPWRYCPRCGAKAVE